MEDVKKINDMVNKLFDSFVNEEDFEGKRFDRYVKKTKDFIYEILKEVYPIVFDEKNDLGFVAYNFEDFIISVFNSFYFDDEETNDATLFDSIHDYFIPSFDVSESNKEYKKNFIQIPKPKDEPNWSFYNVIVGETKNACKEFIKEKCALKGFDKSNYFLALPETTFEAFYILKNIINWIYIDIERITDSRSIESMETLMHDEIYQEMNKKIKEDEVELKEKTDLITKKDEIIEKLENELKNKDDKIKIDVETLKENNSVLSRQNKKLIEKYNELIKKYDSLKIEIGVEDVEDKKEDIEMKELDMLGNYVFVVYDDASFAYKLKDVFKNSLFINSNKTINKETTDLVIALTSHIDHTTYNAIKNQCKSKGIPFIHCDYCNLELIKQMMWNELNL